MQAEVLKQFRYNLVVKLLDSALYGFGFGFASTVSILPLFLATLTDSTTLIGLISSIQLVGWQLPQLMIARRVSGQTRYKPMVLRMTLHERLPFLGLAVVALLVPGLPRWLAVVLVFALYSWHALGGGFTATPYQSLIARIVPVPRRGAFWGIQSAGFSLLSGISAFLAGKLLVAAPYPMNYAICFFLTSVAMAVSWLFLASTREPAADAPPAAPSGTPYWRELMGLWRKSEGFRWFTAARIFSQFALIGLGFYSIYGVRGFELGMDAIGAMTSLLLFAETLTNPLAGWLGDRIGHRMVFAAGAVALALANLIAIAAPEPGWLYLVFVLAGAGTAICTTSTLTLTVDFGTERERPFYIGLGNTLVAPFTLAAPLVGGTLVDAIGFTAMFWLAVLAAGVTVVLLLLRLSDTVRVAYREPTL